METIRMATMETDHGLRSRAVALGAALIAAAVFFTSLPAAADPPRNGHGYDKHDKHDKGRGKHYKGHYDNRYWRGGKHHGHYDGPRVVVIERPVVLQPSYAQQPVFIQRGGGLDCNTSALSGNKALVGQILGGVGGAVAGAQFGQGTGKLAATAGGTLLGVLLGGSVGGSLDRVDAACESYALETVPSGQTVSWQGPGRGAQYGVTPTQTFQTDTGEFCREYTTSALVGGQTSEVYGIACRDANGSWHLRE
jgi:surface antigen